MSEVKIVILKEDIGFVPTGKYAVRKSEDRIYDIIEGPYTGYKIPIESCDEVKEYPIDYVKKLETKIAVAARKLEEKEVMIKKAHRRLGDITQTLTKARDEFGGEFVLPPDYPVTAIENMIYRIRSLNKENKDLEDKNRRWDAANDSYKTDFQHIAANLHDFLSSMEIEHDEDDVIDMSEKLKIAHDGFYKLPGEVHESLDDILSRYGITHTDSLRDKVRLLSDNVRGKRPVEVPRNVAESLDKINKTFPLGEGYTIVKLYEHFGWASVSHLCYDIMHIDIKNVADWRDSYPHTFTEASIYGYVPAKKTEREIRNEKLDTIMEALSSGVTTKERAIELVQELYDVDCGYEVVDDDN